MPTDRVHRPHQQAQPRIRTPPHGQALHHWACAHVVEGLFIRLWSRPLIVAGIGVVSQGPEEGQAAVPVGGGGAAPPVWRTPEGTAAVPVGGGRAWPGFEIDHSERSSRVAISRAGRRPPARTAARSNKIGPEAAGDLSGQQATSERGGPLPQAPTCKYQHADTNTQPQTHRHNEAARPHRGPGGSRVRPLGGSQRLFQRI